MFVTRRALVALFILGFCLCIVFIAVVNPFDVDRNIGSANIFLSPGDGETKDKVSSNTKKKDKVIDLAISSPQPASTKFPRGKGPAPAEAQEKTEEKTEEKTQVKHKIPDSYLHVKQTKDILDFVHNQCEKHHQITALPGEAKKPRMLIVPKNWREHMMVYASNPKTGSTSFKKWYLRIQGDKRNYTEMTGVHAMGKYGRLDEVYEWVEEDLGREARLIDAVEKLYKVVAVRNPIVKLMSGFRDKILRRTKEGIKEPMLEINPNLNINSTDAEKYAAFVEAVVTKKISNFHFSPQWEKMSICDYPYDMIMQTETTEQQIREVQEHTNTQEHDFPGSRSQQGYDSVATVHLAHEFYSKVSPELMERLYHYFRWDFVLLGYSKLDNPNFPYLDYNQDIDKEFGGYIKDEMDAIESDDESSTEGATLYFTVDRRH